MKLPVQEGHDDHFHAKGGKALRAQYLEFWDKLVRECHATEILYDAALLETLSDLVIGLSWYGQHHLATPSNAAHFADAITPTKEMQSQSICCLSAMEESLLSQFSGPGQ